jgi:hypothetical protein
VKGVGGGDWVVGCWMEPISWRLYVVQGRGSRLLKCWVCSMVKGAWWERGVCLRRVNRRGDGGFAN